METQDAIITAATVCNPPTYNPAEPKSTGVVFFPEAQEMAASSS
jgi:hypothetical protein